MADATVIHASDSDFEEKVINQEGAVLVDFFGLNGVARASKSRLH